MDVSAVRACTFSSRLEARAAFCPSRLSYKAIIRDTSPRLSELGPRTLAYSTDVWCWPCSASSHVRKIQVLQGKSREAESETQFAHQYLRACLETNSLFHHLHSSKSRPACKLRAKIAGVAQQSLGLSDSHSSPRNTCCSTIRNFV